MLVTRACRRLLPGAGSVFGIWLMCACVYALSIGAGFYSSDGDVMFQTTAALVEHGALTLPADPALPQIAPGASGHYYSKYEPGLPLLSAPFYAAGDWVARVNSAHRTTLAAIFTLLLPVTAGALTVTLLDALARQLSYPARARWVALAAALGTPLWVYARQLFAEAVLALALTGAVVLAARTVTRPAARGALLAGGMLGVGIMTRAALAIYALPLAALLVLQTPPPRWPAAGVRLAMFGLGAAPFVLIVLGHNALRFDDPLRFGYADEGFSTPVWEGIAGLLISPGRSVFMYAPPLALSALLWPRFRRAQPDLGAFLALAWAVALPFYGAWWAWGGGWSWGPRLLVPLMPLSCLPLCVLPPGRRWRWAALTLIALGAAIQLLGVLTDVTPHYAALAADGTRREIEVQFAPGAAPLVSAVRRASRGQTEPLAAFHLADAGLPASWVIGAPALLIGGAIVGACLLLRRTRVGARTADTGHA